MAQLHTQLNTEEPPLPIDKDILRDKGKEFRSREPEVLDGERWKTIRYTLPTLRRWIMVCTGVAILGATLTLVSFWTRPKPLLLATYPDGTLRCAPLPMNAQGQAMPRSTRDRQLCAMLDRRVGIEQEPSS